MEDLKQIAKNPAHLASLLHALAGLVETHGMDEGHDHAPAMPTIAYESGAMRVAKTDDEQQLAFGWASVAVTHEGMVVDSEGDVIDPADLERAAYQYVLHSREAGERHDGGPPVGRIVESLVMTPEKAVAMGLPATGTTAWWIGVKIDDPAVYQKVKSGEYAMFSIEGTATVEPVE